MSLLLLFRPTTAAGPPPADVTIPGPLIAYREPSTLAFTEPGTARYQESAVIRGSDQ